MNANMKQKNTGEVWLEKEIQNDKNNQSLRDFAEGTTLHGFKHITGNNSSPNKLKQTIWGMLFVSLLGFCIYLLVITIMRYFKYESTTTTFYERNSILEMPSVTICNMHPYNRTKYMNNPHALTIGNYYSYILDVNSSYYSNSTLRNTLDDQMRNIEVFDFNKAQALTINETFISCKFFGSIINCSDYVEYLYTELGMCFIFNSKDRIEANGSLWNNYPGESLGLQLVLNTNSEYGLDQLSEIGDGFRVLVHSPDVFPLMTKKSYVVAPGFQTYLSLTKTTVDMLSKPYSNAECYSSNSGSYSQEMCSYKCGIVAIYNRTCLLSEAKPDDDQFSQCNLYEQFQILAPGRTVDYESLCNQCRMTCDYTSYTPAISMSAFSKEYTLSVAASQNWPSSNNLTFIKENYVQLKIHFTSYDYIKTVQKPTLTFQAVLSDIGGLLGIFLGASFMTLCEVVEFAMSVVYSCSMKNPIAAAKNT